MVESPTFRSFLRASGYELITPVVDAKGGATCYHRISMRLSPGWIRPVQSEYLS